MKERWKAINIRKKEEMGWEEDQENHGKWILKRPTFSTS